MSLENLLSKYKNHSDPYKAVAAELAGLPIQDVTPVMRAKVKELMYVFMYSNLPTEMRMQ